MVLFNTEINQKKRYSKIIEIFVIKNYKIIIIIIYLIFNY